MADQGTLEESVPNGAPYAAIDGYVQQQMRRLGIPGVALAIVEGEKIVHLRGLGRARPGGEPPSPHTPFPIGSLTKSFTALAVMQLVEAGQVELDAPVQRYLPWFRVADARASARITVRHLLNQTSGLPASSGEVAAAQFDRSPGAAERHARSLAALRLAHPAGSAWEYSNSNYVLLGLIIEACSGESYADYIRRRVLTPLDMIRTYTSQTAAKRNNLAVGHQFRFMVPRAAPNMPLSQAGLAGGGLISCVEDLAHIIVSFLNQGRYGETRILSAAGVEDMHRGAGDVKAFGLSLGKYGMGWFVGKIGKTKLVWHGGTLPDFAAHMALLPEQKKGVVLLFNASHHWMNPVLADLGNGVAAMLAGESHSPLPFFHAVPWALRGQLLLPALQVLGAAGALRRLRRWLLDPESRPRDGRTWGSQILLPLIPSLLAALTLKPLLGQRRGYLWLYLSDWAWLATICGSLGLLWSLIHVGLVGWALAKTSPDRSPIWRQALRQPR